MPRVGHLHALLHVFGYLSNNHNATMAFDPTYPDVDYEAFKDCDWKEFCGDVKEAIPPNAPPARGKVAFSPMEIGNKSIRSGAAVSLFLADHTPAKIMMLGRWLSDAFLDCIRPQVLEWTNNMSDDMINFDSFWDLSSSANTDRLIRDPINGLDSLSNAPAFHLRH